MPEKRQNIKKLTETGFIPVCLIVKNRPENQKQAAKNLPDTFGN